MTQLANAKNAWGNETPSGIHGLIAYGVTNVLNNTIMRSWFSKFTNVMIVLHQCLSLLQKTTSPNVSTGLQGGTGSKKKKNSNPNPPASTQPAGQPLQSAPPSQTAATVVPVVGTQSNNPGNSQNAHFPKPGQKTVPRPTLAYSYGATAIMPSPWMKISRASGYVELDVKGQLSRYSPMTVKMSTCGAAVLADDKEFVLVDNAGSGYCLQYALYTLLTGQETSGVVPYFMDGAFQVNSLLLKSTGNYNVVGTQD